MSRPSPVVDIIYSAAADRSAILNLRFPDWTASGVFLITVSIYGTCLSKGMRRVSM